MSMWFQIYTSLLQTKYTADSQCFQNSAGRLRVQGFPAPGLDCGYFADVTEKLNWIISSSAKSVATLTRVAKTRTFIIQFRNVKVQGISFDPQRSTTLLHTLQCCSIQARVFLAGCCRPAKVTPTSAGCPTATVFCQTRGASHLLMASSWGNTNQPPHRRGLSPYRQLVAYLPSSPPPRAAIPHTWCIGSHTAGLNYYLITFYKWSGLLALAGVISGEYLETDTLLIQIRYPA